MKTIGNRIFKIILAVLVFAISYLIGKTFRFSYYYTVMFLCPFSVLYILLQIIQIFYDIKFIKRLVEKIAPYLHPAMEKIKCMWSTVTNLLFKFAHSSVIYQKFEELHLKNNSRITGYSDEFIKHTGKETSHDYEINQLKWKKCQSNAERVRFLYAKYVTWNRKHGNAFSYSDTPAQLQEIWGKDDYNTSLISSYYTARYDEQEEISDELVQRLTEKKM